MDNDKLILADPLRDLIRACETNCVAGCCGLDAFDFSVQAMTEWARGADAAARLAAGDQIGELIRSVASSGAEHIDSDDMNAVWPVRECIDFLTGLHATLQKAMQRCP